MAKPSKKSPDDAPETQAPQGGVDGGQNDAFGDQGAGAGEQSSGVASAASSAADGGEENASAESTEDTGQSAPPMPLTESSEPPSAPIIVATVTAPVAKVQMAALQELRLYDLVHEESKQSARRKNYAAHALLHPVELALAQARNAIAEAEKKASGGTLELLRDLKRII